MKLKYRFIKLIAVIIIINLGIVAAWFVKHQHDENEQMKSDITNIRDELNNLGPNTKQEIVESVKQARKSRISDEQEIILVDRYRKSTSTIASIRVALTEDYANEGQFSENRIKNEFGDLTQYAQDPISRVEIDPKTASVSVYLISPSNGYYRFDATPNTQTGMINWTCKTYNDPLLQRALPECHFHEN